MLARMLGINIKVAVAWQQASSGDWTAYAADVSRRSTRTTFMIRIHIKDLRRTATRRKAACPSAIRAR
jgi:hypothetical protein